jgi:hypothetical protein
MAMIKRSGPASAGAAVAVIVLSLCVFSLFRGGALAAGDVVKVDISLVPSDAVDLDCDATTRFDDQSCAFANGRRQQDSQGALRPFVSLGGELLTLSGVFTSPAVARWLKESLHARSNRRVELSCRVRYLGSFTSVGVRWREDGAFEPQSGIWAGRVEQCKLRR